MPTSLPSIDVLRTVVLRCNWNTRSKRNDLWRLRTVAALCVVLAVPRGTPMTTICAMMPADVLRLRMPAWAKRRVRKWLGIRASYYGRSPWDDPSAEVPWLAIPAFPKSDGKPRSIAWSIMRTLARRRAPCWRVRQLLRGPRWFGLPIRR